MINEVIEQFLEQKLRPRRASQFRFGRNEKSRHRMYRC